MNSISISEAVRKLPQLVEKNSEENKVITLTEDGQAKAVLLNWEMFEYLIGIKKYLRKELLPLEKLENSMRNSLKEAGYNSPSEIIQLVQDVKKEMANERDYCSEQLMVEEEIETNL